MRYFVLIVAATLCAGAVYAADEPADKAAVTKDLTAVIALQGLPCGKVIRTTRQAENDYLATCQNGMHYRVYVNADGRVVVEKK